MIVQLGVPAVPEELPYICLIGGISILLVVFLLRHLPVAPDTLVDRTHRKVLAVYWTAAFLLIAVGYVNTFYSFDTTTLYVLYLGALGQVIQGAANAGGIQKIVLLLKDLEWRGNTKRRVKFLVVKIFSLLLAVYLLLQLFKTYPAVFPLQKRLLIIWTFTTLILTFFGLLYYLSYAQDRFSLLATIGMALAISGANIFDYTIQSTLVEVFIGGAAYSLGFWWSMLVWFDAEFVGVVHTYVERIAQMWQVIVSVLEADADR